MSNLPVTVTTESDSNHSLHEHQPRAAPSANMGASRFPGVEGKDVPDTRSVDSHYGGTSIVVPDSEPYDSGNFSPASINLQPAMSVGDTGVLTTVQQHLEHNIAQAVHGKTVQDKSSHRASPSSTCGSYSSSYHVQDVTDNDIQKLKSQMPVHLKVDYQDAMVLYCEDDRDSVIQFLEAFQDMKLKDKELPMVLLYDEIATSIGSKIQALEFGLERCTYIFLFVTKSFCKDAWAGYSSETCLVEAIHNEDKRWCVVPVFTEAKRNATFRVPPSLNSFKGLQYWSNDKFFRDSVKRLLEDKLHVRHKHEQELLGLRKDWVSKERIRKINEDVREKKECEARQQQEIYARHQGEMQLRNLTQSGNQFTSHVETQNQELCNQLGVHLNPPYTGHMVQPSQEDPEYSQPQFKQGVPSYSGPSQAALQPQASQTQQAAGFGQRFPTQDTQAIPCCPQPPNQTRLEPHGTSTTMHAKCVPGPATAATAPNGQFSSLLHPSNNRAVAVGSSGSQSLPSEFTQAATRPPMRSDEGNAQNTTPASSQAQPLRSTAIREMSFRAGPSSLEPDCGDPGSLRSMESIHKSQKGPGMPQYPHSLVSDPMNVKTDQTEPKTSQAPQHVEPTQIHYHYHYYEESAASKDPQPINIVGARVVQIGEINAMNMPDQATVLDGAGGDRSETRSNVDTHGAPHPSPHIVQPKETLRAGMHQPASTIFQDNSACVGSRLPASTPRAVVLPSRPAATPGTPTAVQTPPATVIETAGTRGSGRAHSSTPAAAHVDVDMLTSRGSRPSANQQAPARGDDGDDNTQVKQVVATIPRQARAADDQTLLKGNVDEQDISEQTLAKIRAIESEID